MKTLEFKHIAGYLPYSLKLERINYKNERFKILSAYDLCPDGEIDNLKPILHPLSDLTKEITHNGETFVPIVELAKLIWSDLKAFLLHPTRNELITDYSSMFYKEAKYKTLDYKNNSFSFNILNKYFIIIGHYTVINQLELFQKLFEWHFDIHNLIEQGLAIDINTI